MNTITSMNAAAPTGFGWQYLPTSLRLRLGRRELLLCKDFRSRYYAVNPVLDCSVGVHPGHLELLVCGKWLLIFSKAS